MPSPFVKSLITSAATLVLLSPSHALDDLSTLTQRHGHISVGITFEFLPHERTTGAQPIKQYASGFILRNDHVATALHALKPPPGYISGPISVWREGLASDGLKAALYRPTSNSDQFETNDLAVLNVPGITLNGPSPCLSPGPPALPVDIIQLGYTFDPDSRRFVKSNSAGRIDTIRALNGSPAIRASLQTYPGNSGSPIISSTTSAIIGMTFGLIDDPSQPDPALIVFRDRLTLLSDFMEACPTGHQHSDSNRGTHTSWTQRYTVIIAVIAALLVTLFLRHRHTRQQRPAPDAIKQRSSAAARAPDGVHFETANAFLRAMATSRFALFFDVRTPSLQCDSDEYPDWFSPAMQIHLALQDSHVHLRQLLSMPINIDNESLDQSIRSTLLSLQRNPEYARSLINWCVGTPSARIIFINRTSSDFLTDVETGRAPQFNHLRLQHKLLGIPLAVICCDELLKLITLPVVPLGHTDHDFRKRIADFFNDSHKMAALGLPSGLRDTAPPTALTRLRDALSAMKNAQAAAGDTSRAIPSIDFCWLKDAAVRDEQIWSAVVRKRLGTADVIEVVYHPIPSETPNTLPFLTETVDTAAIQGGHTMSCLLEFAEIIFAHVFEPGVIDHDFVPSLRAIGDGLRSSTHPLARAHWRPRRPFSMKDNLDMPIMPLRARLAEEGFVA